MSFKSLSHFINNLKRENEILVIKEFVDPVLHISEITDRISSQEGGGKALLFENNGTKFPLLINAFGSQKRICMALNINDIDEVGQEIEKLITFFMSKKNSLYSKIKILPELNHLSSLFPKQIKGKGECQEIICKTPDLSIFPILKCWPADGGRFITLPLVHTKDPNTGLRNVGMYRMQIFDKDLTGMHWHNHKTGYKHYLEYKKQGKKMPVAVALGGDPTYTYSATAPLPENLDEYILAGFLRKQKVELVKCITQDIEVPKDVDIVIEGYVDPEEDLILEGPFGDHTGFYSLPDLYPRFHVTCITHKKDAVYPATIVGIPPQEDAWIAKATERIFLMPLKIAVLPEIADIDLPVAGVAHNLTIVKIKKQFSYQQLKAMNTLWGAGQMMFNKILIITDENVDIHNYFELLKYILENVDIANDIYFSSGTLDVLDHSSSKISVGGKMFIDATKKFFEENKDIYNKSKSALNIDINNIKNSNPEIVAINDKLLKDNISLIVISIVKNKSNQVNEISNNILKNQDLRNIKIIIFVDKEVDIYDLSMVTWVCCNNIDPQRDSKIINNLDKNSQIIIDGTRKTKIYDKFERDWPNIIISDDITINQIDNIWDKLNIGEFVKSPSLKYKNLKYSEGAVAEEFQKPE